MTTKKSTESSSGKSSEKSKKDPAKKNIKTKSPSILNDKFEFIEVGESNVLIAPDGEKFFAVNRDLWNFLYLFKYGAKLDYVVQSIDSHLGKTSKHKTDYVNIFRELEAASVILKSKKFINPRIDSIYCTKKPVLKMYDRKWIEDNHPELLISVNFSDTWSPAGDQ